MNLYISPSSDEPIYRQLYAQISAQILRGELTGGTCLPPIRTVAAELRVSVITIKKTWEMLEADGLIFATTGRGSFVAELSDAEKKDRSHADAKERLRKCIAECRTMGLDAQTITELLHQCLKEET